ncbi:MAG: hypothetical protein ABJB01_10800 [Rudaea sp.]
MKTLLLTALVLFSATSQSQACSVSGQAFTLRGQPLHGATVRLVDLDSQSQMFGTTDASAAFVIDTGSASAQHVRLDVLSEPTVVTGTRIPTRSIIGQSDAFACQSSREHQDVHVQID